jgi:hypothetical protein
MAIGILWRFARGTEAWQENGVKVRQLCSARRRRVKSRSQSKIEGEQPLQLRKL